MSAETPDRTRILVVDDDENLRRLIAAYLESEGYGVRQAADGNEALAEFHEQEPQLVVLDLMLPGVNGFDVARKIRATGKTPILMLTARGSEDDVLRGFEAGADDYLVKPFSPKVLVARVKAILRRSGASIGDEVAASVSLDGITIDPRAHEVWVDGREAELTTTEFDLLSVLAEHPGWVHTREELLESVWGYSYLGDSRLVDVHVANLRKKIGDDPADPHFIHTVRGVGYKFQPQAADRLSQAKGKA
jgi:DNA-binding response OmpR family regulator